MTDHGRREEIVGAAPAPESRAAPAQPAAPVAASGAAQVLGLQRSVGNAAVVRYLEDRGTLSTPGDAQEAEADGIARAVMRDGATPAGAAIARSPSPAAPPAGDVGGALGAIGPGEPLSPAVRAFMEPRFGTDFGDVRVHTGSGARQASRALQAEAFTYGSDIYYGDGKAPSNDELTAHELAHVVQQRVGAGQVAARRIQRSFAASFPVSLGVFEVDLQTREGGVNTPPTHSGFDGYIRFVPDSAAPNSNKIVFIQIVKLTDVGGADVDPATMPAGQAPRGGLGDPGLRTEDDAARGVEGGFFTDVHHRPNAGAPGHPQGTPLSPNYNFQPAAPGTVGPVGGVQQPPQYGGGTGGQVGQTPGFKRSADAVDIRSAALYDTPGIASAARDLNFDFESVARGEDTMVVYGAVKWGFGIRSGRVVNEYLDPVDAASATFQEALDRHRDFYVHEPVTFYFDFNDEALPATEASKIDALLDYLARNPTVRMSLEGFADQRGGAGPRNRALSQRRAEAVRDALIAKGVDAGRINAPVVATGASTSATADAGTGDQGGDPAVGADQDREENRWANRRVLLTFEQTASTPVGGAGP